MRDWRVRWGVIAGVCAAAVVIAAEHTRGRGAAVGGGALVSDCDGAIEELVIQYVPEAAEAVATAYAEFLSQLPGDVTVHVVCPEAAAFEDLAGRAGIVECRLSPILAGHPMTAWARDRWLALAPVGRSQPVTLVTPREEAAASVWPARAGDGRLGDDIAAALGGRVTSVRSGLYFDGGDFVADDRTAFVSPRVLERNLQRTVRSEADLVDELARVLKRKIVLLDEAPSHHAGMYMMAVGDGKVVVGDPDLALRFVARRGGASEFPVPVGADFSARAQRRFDAVARQCAAAGYRVVRVPVVPGLDERTYLTYTNVIIDRRGAALTVYMPVYEGAGILNEAAGRAWRELGYEVRPVDCTAAYPHFGSLRCLVNVLRRSPAG